MPWPFVSGVVLTGGTSTTAGFVLVGLLSTPAVRVLRGAGGGEGKVRFCWWGRPGTLLGPEGAAVVVVSFRSGLSGPDEPLVSFGGWVGAGVWVVTGGCLRTAQWTRASLNDLCGQVYKGTGWMPWHQEPKKDVVACDKPRGVGKRTVIRGCPNGETPPQSCAVTLT